jgi:hypothetical protein
MNRKETVSDRAARRQAIRSLNDDADLFGRRFRRSKRQINKESGACALLALSPYLAAVALYHAMADGQAQAGALAHFLGGKEGIEETRQNIPRVSPDRHPQS